VDYLGTPLLVVLGHEKCGAVKAVLDGQELHGNLRPLWEKILPAVQEAGKTRGHHLERKSSPIGGDFASDHSGTESEEDRLLEEAVRVNVWNSVEAALLTSESLRKKVIAEQLLVVGAYYHIVSGRVDWMGTHPRQDRLLTAITR
jgi:carbonic anhydrase